MPDKYFDCRNKRPIHPGDGVPLNVWPERSGQAPFAIHPDGFWVFLPPDQISISDEYAQGDPYKMEYNLETSFHQRRLELTLEMLSSAMADCPEEARILDVGCGEGHLTAAFKGAYPRAEVTALDRSVHAIRQARALFTDIDFLVSNAYEPPFVNYYFDVVICNNVWEHVPDPLYLLASLDRVVRPDGYLIISTPSRFRIDNLLRTLVGKSVVLMNKYHVTEYTVGQVVDQLRFGGFDVRKVASRRDPEDRYSFKTIKGVFKNLLIVGLRLYCRLIGNPHTLESTVFFLARKASPLNTRSLNEK